MNNYKIIFKGELTPNACKEDILVLLSKHLQISKDNCSKLFDGSAYTLKNDISHVQAQSIYNQLIKLGLITHIVDKSENNANNANNANNDSASLNEYWSIRFKLFDSIQEEGTYSLYRLLKKDKAKQLTRKEVRKLTSNLVALIIGPYYYLIKKMWAKGLILLTLSNLFAIFGTSVEILINQTLPEVIYWIPMNVICSAMVNYDYYKHVKFNEQLWDGIPRFFKNLWISTSICLLTFLCSLAIINYGPDTDEAMLENIDGVWQASDGSEIIEIDLSKHHRLVVGNKSVPISIRNIDHDNHIVSLVMVDPNTNQNVIWALRQVYDDDGRFTLDLALHNGESVELNFIRRL